MMGPFKMYAFAEIVSDEQIIIISKQKICAGWNKYR